MARELHDFVGSAATYYWVVHFTVRLYGAHFGSLLAMQSALIREQFFILISRISELVSASKSELVEPFGVRCSAAN